MAQGKRVRKCGERKPTDGPPLTHMATGQQRIVKTQRVKNNKKTKQNKTQQQQQQQQQDKYRLGTHHPSLGQKRINTIVITVIDLTNRTR